jgi:tight adherence protein C
MTFTLIAFIVMLTAAVAAGGYAVVTERQRRAVLDRVQGYGDGLLVLRPDEPALGERIGKWLAGVVPSRWAAKGEVTSTLVHAGFDGPAAPLVFTTVRIAAAAVPPVLAFALMPRANALQFVGAIALSAVVGLMAPTAMVNKMARERQEKLQRQLPDCLDLLVVCVEAGVSLDAAIMRVAREMATVHPDLSAELMQVTRRVNAGVPRDQALQGLYTHTGVTELRSLAANMVQSEKWGTSIATVLRVFAEGLRRRRKQAAEKKAATAPLRMMLPLALFIFPTLFVVLLGPAMINITAMFRTINNK